MLIRLFDADTCSEDATMPLTPALTIGVTPACRALLSSLQAGVIIHDAQGRVVLCNQRACVMLGMSESEVLGLGPGLGLMRYHEDMTPLSVEQGPVMQVLRTGQAVEDVVIGLKENDHDALRWLLVSARPVKDEGGAVDSVVVTCMDVTQRKHLEELREHAERMVRHDLKSPLAGMIDGLRYMLELDLSPEAHEMAEHALEHGKQCLRRIEESAALFRMERDQYELEPETFNLARHLRALPAAFAELMHRRRLQLDVQVDSAPLGPDTVLECYGEVVHLDALLLNLVQNAMEAAPDNAIVSVRAETLSHGGLLLEVKNPGAVPGPIRQRFFERYVTYGKSDGTGLGTYIARLIAQAHGGSIAMTASDAENTTTVSVELPGPSAD